MRNLIKEATSEVEVAPPSKVSNLARGAIVTQLVAKKLKAPVQPKHRAGAAAFVAAAAAAREAEAATAAAPAPAAEPATQPPPTPKKAKTVGALPSEPLAGAAQAKKANSSAGVHAPPDSNEVQEASATEIQRVERGRLTRMQLAKTNR